MLVRRSGLSGGGDGEWWRPSPAWWRHALCCWLRLERPAFVASLVCCVGGGDDGGSSGDGGGGGGGSGAVVVGVCLI